MPFVSSVRGNYSGAGKRKTLPAESSTGGTITTAGGYRIHTFTTTGASTFTFGGPTYANAGVVELLVVGGGGGGGGRHGGGGGAGGVVISTNTGVIPATSYTVTVGAGDQQGPQNSGPISATGGNSSIAGPSISTVTAFGGGRGGTHSGAGAHPGGSGGGPSAGPGEGGIGSATQSPQPLSGIGYGFPGGGTAGRNPCGAGGGATEVGNNARGGNGIQSSITGTSYYWGGGGGGAWHTGNGPANGGAGGLGGGGGGGGHGPSSPTNGGTGGISLGSPGDWRTNGNGGNGGNNTGGGGGGAGEAPSHGNAHPGGNGQGGAGGPGIVVVRYIV